MHPVTPARMQRHRTLPQRLAHIGQSWITAVRQSALEAAMYCAELEQAEAQRRLAGAQAARVASAGGLATDPVTHAGDPAPRHLSAQSLCRV